jgi:hypothetical protein
MRKLSFPAVLLLILALGLAVSPAGAQETPSQDTTATSRGPRAVSDRLFLSFVEDTAIADRQWWEGRFEVADGDVVDSTLLRGVVAVQPWTNVELGGRFGFGNTDTSRGLPDGSGGTDLDLWGKYKIRTDSPRTDFSFGGILTVPTGDNTAGLGLDAFGIGVFGAMRHSLKSVTLGGNIGVQINGDGETLGSPELDGETSVMIGAMVMAPITKVLNLIGEINYKGERLEGFDPDSRVLGGVNWRITRRGTLRAAIAFGLDDGAPDGQLIVGYAAEF